MFRFLAIFIAIIIVSACSDFKQRAGLIKEAPDEFTVITQPALIIPPNFELVPPKDADDDFFVTDTEAQAKNALRESLESENISDETDSELSQGEVLLLRRTDAVNVDNNIRKRIEKDNSQHVIVNSKKEAKRIKENLESGRAINDGDVLVIIDKKDKAILEDVF